MHNCDSLGNNTLASTFRCICSTMPAVCNYSYSYCLVVYQHYIRIIWFHALRLMCLHYNHSWYRMISNSNHASTTRCIYSMMLAPGKCMCCLVKYHLCNHQIEYIRQSLKKVATKRLQERDTCPSRTLNFEF